MIAEPLKTIIQDIGLLMMISAIVNGIYLGIHWYFNVHLHRKEWWYALLQDHDTKGKSKKRKRA